MTLQGEREKAEREAKVDVVLPWTDSFIVVMAGVHTKVIKVNSDIQASEGNATETPFIEEVSKDQQESSRCLMG
jgi:hypothetical protein